MATVGRKAYNLAAISHICRIITMLAFVRLRGDVVEDSDTYITSTPFATSLDELTRCYTALERHFYIPKEATCRSEHNAILRNKIQCRAWTAAMTVYLGTVSNIAAVYANISYDGGLASQERYAAMGLLDSMREIGGTVRDVDFISALEGVICDTVRNNKNAELTRILTDTSKALTAIMVAYSENMGHSAPYNVEIANLLCAEVFS